MHALLASNDGHHGHIEIIELASHSNAHTVNHFAVLRSPGFLKKRVPIFTYKLRYIVGFRLFKMAISTNPKPSIYHNLYEDTGPGEMMISVMPNELKLLGF